MCVFIEQHFILMNNYIIIQLTIKIIIYYVTNELFIVFRYQF